MIKKGLGQGVAERTVLRKTNNEFEQWSDVATRVYQGSNSLSKAEPECLNALLNAQTIMSGRHLEHGDATQHTKNMELFTNCCTAALSSLAYYLGLNGSGVGRNYSDALMVQEWEYYPQVISVLSSSHPDYNDTIYNHSQIGNLLQDDTKIIYHIVGDTREQWAKAFEVIENNLVNRSTQVILDFSKIRPRGAPIMGLHGKPASGPVPMIEALGKIQEIVKSATPENRWEMSMYIDHYLAEVIRMGGARRASRIACKYWKDAGILKFIKIKQEGGLWTANNSILVDREFWDGVDKGDEWATKVFDLFIETSYASGEPGLINVDKLKRS